MASFDTSGANQPMNKGTYGFPLPPNAATRVAPPEWKSFKAFTVPGSYTT